MSNMSSFFGPLSKEWCNYFLILSMVFFVGFILFFISELIYIVTNFRKLNMRVIFNGFIALFSIFISYFVNRLFYTMCSKSLI